MNSSGDVGESSLEALDTDTQSSSCSHQSAELDNPAENEGSFFFESDHLALRGNRDFQKLLSTLALLEAQRMQAAKDLDNLLLAQKRSLEEPIVFVEKLQQKNDLGLPKRQRIAALPNIPWDKYSSNFDPSSIGQSHRTRLRHKTGTSRPSSPSTSSSMSTDAINGQLVTIENVNRPANNNNVVNNFSANNFGANNIGSNNIGANNIGANNIGANNIGANNLAAVEPESASCSSSRAPSPVGHLSAQDLNSVFVRGRVKEESKPETFNVLWTAEEQCRLEQLLLKFPPERVEARRWEKIAVALGNRSTQQVASRVQKYFIKLAKAGLPIPGRMPNVNHYVKRSNHRHQRFNRFYFQPSTFMTSYEPPVYMSDDEDSCPSSSGQWSGHAFNNGPGADYISDDEEISPEMKSTPEYQEYVKLKKMQKVVIHKEGHLGYKCDRCESEPIVGTRWHCVDCPPETSVDFCTDCSNSNYEVGTHLQSHRLDAIRPPLASSVVDNDYTKFMPGDYNYLDPNYMPAV